MWNIKKLKQYREINSLYDLADNELKEIVNVLNDMKKGLDKISDLENEPFFDFYLLIERKNDEKYR